MTDFSIGRNNMRLLAESWPAVLLYFVVTTVPFIYLDMYRWEDDLAYWVLVVFTIGADIMLLIAVLRSGGYVEASVAHRILPLILVSIVSSFAILGALLIFVLPGILLIVRWLPAYTRSLLSEDIAIETLRWSWTKTGPHWKQLLLAMVFPVVLGLVEIAAILHREFSYMAHDECWPAYEWANSILVNFAGAGLTIWLTILGVSAFDLVTREEG